MIAAQGIEFLRPLSSSEPLEAAHGLLRTGCPSIDVDRYLAPDIEHASALVAEGALGRILHTLRGLPPLWTPA